MEYCPHCGCDGIISDYFEEEWLYWCGHCGRDLTADVMHEESLMYDEERKEDENQERQESIRN